jgi:hypothetical protein
MSAATAQPRLWPPGGLDHPLFDAPGPQDHVLAVLTFAGPQAEPALQQAEAALQAWSRGAGRLDPNDAVHAEEPWLSRTSLRVRAHNLQHPREALRRLLTRLEQAGVPVAEAFFSRLEPIGGGLYAPARAPAHPRERAHFHDADEFLATLFDPAAEPPASEYESQLRGAIRLPTGELLLEERGMPLYLPGLRLGYGNARGGFTAPDARTREVRDALSAALDASFRGLLGKRPTFFDHTGRPGELDRLSARGRVGYGFGVPSAELVYRYTQELYRYREPELFEAVEQAVAKLGLSSAVAWQRYGEALHGELRASQMHVVQLWEK